MLGLVRDVHPRPWNLTRSDTNDFTPKILATVKETVNQIPKYSSRTASNSPVAVQRSESSLLLCGGIGGQCVPLAQQTAAWGRGLPSSLTAAGGGLRGGAGPAREVFV